MFLEYNLEKTIDTIEVVKEIRKLSCFSFVFVIA